MSGSADVPEEKWNHVWTLLPSFDPATDNVREYIEKVKFIDSICPKKDRPMLAPQLAMLCRGTAWGQVKNLKSEDLMGATNSVKNLLQALSSWEESTEMRTYEQFERAIYKTVQKSDGSQTHSGVPCIPFAATERSAARGQEESPNHDDW